VGWQFVEDEDGTIVFIRNPQDKKRPRVSFTREDLDASFPIRKYEDLEIAFEQTS